MLDFARDLQKLLETLEKKFGYKLTNSNAFYKKKIEVRGSELTERLYYKYKNILNLEISYIDEMAILEKIFYLLRRKKEGIKNLQIL